MEGSVVVTKKSETNDDLVVNNAKQFQFVGSPEFLSGKKEFEVTIRAEEMTRIYNWPLEILRELLKKNPRFQDAIVAAISQDLAMKLFTANAHALNELSQSPKSVTFAPEGIEANPAFHRTLSTRFLKEIKIPMTETEKLEVTLPV